MGPMLGIESSCDETAAAVLDADGRVLAERLASQLREHAPYGGVVPEIAARAHLALLPEMVRDVLAEAGLGVGDLGGVAATTGPGLIGGLIVGSQFGKGLALAGGVPFVAVNHLEAHALTARLPGLVPDGAPFPYLLLLVSGGHCQIVRVDGVGHYRVLGRTVDDAVGEAFDKVAKLLGLGWPGGPAVERLAAEGDPRRYAFPRPMLGRPGCDFSFSGLKTAVAQAVARFGDGALPRATRGRSRGRFPGGGGGGAGGAGRACDGGLGWRGATAGGGRGRRGESGDPRSAGGARRSFGFRLAAPPLRLCTDNAVMVAWAGIERLRLGLTDALDAPPRPRWGLEEINRDA